MSHLQLKLLQNVYLQLIVTWNAWLCFSPDMWCAHLLLPKSTVHIDSTGKWERERERSSFIQAEPRCSPSFRPLLPFFPPPLFFSFALPLSYKDSIPSRSMWSILPSSSNFPLLSPLLALHYSQVSLSLSLFLSPSSLSLFLSLCCLLSSTDVCWKKKPMDSQAQVPILCLRTAEVAKLLQKKERNSRTIQPKAAEFAPQHLLLATT